MSDSLFLENIEASLHSFTKTLAGALSTDQNPVTNVDFDAYEESDELPANDVVGIANLSLTMEEHIVSVTCLVGVATFNDLAITRLRRHSALILNELKPTRVVPYLDAQTGERISDLTITTDTRMMPVSGGDGRPARFFMVRMYCATALVLDHPVAI